MGEAAVLGPVVLDNMQPVVWIVTVPFALLCLTSIVVRLYTRRFIVKVFGADNWFMLAVGPVWIGQQYIAWMWTILGGGLHAEKVPPENIALIDVYLFAEEFYYLLLQFLIKMSFLCFYLRTLTTTARFQHAVYVVMGLVCCQTVGTWIFYGLQCIPINAFFHPELYPADSCVAFSLSYYLPSVANVSIDMVIYVMPIFPLWSLQVPLRRRVGLLAIFTMGGGAVAVSLLRFIELWQLSNTGDVAYVFGSVTLVTSVEFAAAVVTANMPGTAAFLQHVRTTRRRGDGEQSSLEVSGGGGGAGEAGALELETIGAKPSRQKQYVLDSVLESRYDDSGPRKTESEEKLTDNQPGTAF